MRNIRTILLCIIFFHLIWEAGFCQSINVQFHYDNLHHLATETYSNGLVVQYTYDNLGNRATKTISGSTCAAPTASFTHSEFNLAVTFANSTQNGTYAWDFGNGQTSTAANPSVTYATAGTYQVCLTSTNACGSDQKCQQITVPNCTSPVAGFSHTATYLGVSFASTSTNAVTHAWTFGDGQSSYSPNPTITYAAPGTYNVCLLITNLCGIDQVCQQITVNSCPAPVAGFSQTANYLAVSFTNTSTNGTTYAWDFGNGQTSTAPNPSITYAAAGTYNVCLTTTSNCGTNQVCQQITVNSCPAPVAGFSQTANYLAVSFTNTSTNGTTYAWNFGNGQTSTAANPSITYAASGTYNVCLTTTSNCGSNQVCQQITVNSCPAPVAGFSQTANYLAVSFTNTSTNATTYAWNFGNGQTSTAANPSITYAAAGTYNVCLTTTNNCGTNQVCQQITVTCALPVAGFTKSATNLAVAFTNTSTGGTSYAWTFGDGQTSTQANPNVTYAVPGTYNVCLTTTNSCGPQQYCQQITVVCPLPVAGFTKSANNLVVNFSNTSTGGTSYAWNFGDGQTSTLANPNVTYAVPGTYNVCLTTTNSCGTNQYCQQITVVCPLPVAGFTKSANNLVVNFSNTSSGGTTYAWNFGDGQTSAIANPVVTYATSGVYNVCLSVSNGCGTNQYCQTITVSYPCISSVNAGTDELLCQGSLPVLKGTSSASGYSYNWSPTQGLTTPASSFTMALPSGTTQYTLTATQAGCPPVSDQVLITVSPAPVRIFVNKNVVGGSGNGDDWANAVPELGEALWTAQGTSCVNEIWVASGTYYPTRDPNGATNPADPRKKTFYLRDGVKIYGGFSGSESATSQRNISANPTTLSGDLGILSDSSDNAYYVVLSVADGPATVLDGFQITKGNADVYFTATVEGKQLSGRSGGGIYNISSSPTIRNCRFFRNYTNYQGGGAFNALQSHPTFENDEFIENKGVTNSQNNLHLGGGIFNYASTATIKNCTFSRNSAFLGGGIVNNLSGTTIERCSFDSNQGTTHGGGVTNLGCSTDITSSCFNENSGQVYGGGICNLGNSPAGSPQVTNCTFFNNTGVSKGGGMYNEDGFTPVISNCIFWGNSQSIHDFNTTSSVNYSIIEGGFPGTNNLNVNPIFVNSMDPDGPDNIWRTSDDGLAIASCSPALDIGNSTTVPSTDILGNSHFDVPNVGTSLIDLGAYERQSVQLLTLAISGNSSFCPGSSTLLSATGGMNYSWSTGATTSSITVNSPGIYSVMVNDNQGCTYSASKTVVSSTAPVATITGNTTLCTGGSTTLTASGGGTYFWSTGSQTPSITVNTPGSVFVVVTDTNGCTDNDSVNIISGSPVAVINGPSGICTGSSATLVASGGSNFLWNTGATTASITASIPGTYSVTVSNGNGCFTSASHLVSSLAAPVASISGPSSFCSGTTATLTASGGSSFLWGNGATTPSITIATGGTYSVTVINGNGCASSATHTIVANPAPTPAISGPDTICAGGSATYLASGGIGYSWSTGATTSAIVVNVPGTYSVTISNFLGCADSISKVLTVLPPPVITGPAGICAGDTATLYAFGGSSFLWSTGATSPNIQVSTPGNYSVTATGPGGCTATASTNLNQYSLPVATISGNASICSGDTTVLTASGGINYSWTTGSTSNSISTGVAGIYTVTITDANGCIANSSHTLTVNSLPSPSISGNPVICGNTAMVLTATGGNTYLWNNGATTSSITTSIPGNYSVVATNLNGCTNSANLNVVSYPNPTAIIGGNPAACQGDSVTLIAAGGIDFLWNTGAITPSLSTSVPGNYTAIVTDANGCRDTITQNVAIYPLPNATISGPLSFCQGGSTSLTATGGVSFLWNTGATTSTLVTGISGNYSVAVTDQHGCSDTTSVSLIENPLPSALIFGPASICDGDTATLTASGGVAFSWSTGASTPSIQVTNAGNYSVTVTDLNGCNSIANTSVTLSPLPPTPTISVLGNNLAASAGSAFQWYLNGAPIPGATSQFYTVTQTGFYTVEVTVSGCSQFSQPYAHTYTWEVKESLDFGVKVYPNPNQGEFSIRFDEPTSAPQTLSITNILGQVIFTTGIPPATQTFPVKIPQVSEGLYDLQLLDVESGRRGVFKLVIGR
ncbi:MAG: PKD domain-containing protein [Bacteroidia bacterium]|nr:PKD domain-containing protein [Bacteroidia bacterium]